jgi:hypothetical protein
VSPQEARNGSASAEPSSRSRHPDTPPAYRAVARAERPPFGRTAVKERRRRSYPATKGKPGGKLPAGNGALRSPAFKVSAAVLKSETNQE